LLKLEAELEFVGKNLNLFRSYMELNWIAEWEMWKKWAKTLFREI